MRNQNLDYCRYLMKVIRLNFNEGEDSNDLIIDNLLIQLLYTRMKLIESRLDNDLYYGNPNLSNREVRNEIIDISRKLESIATELDNLLELEHSRNNI